MDVRFTPWARLTSTEIKITETEALHLRMIKPQMQRITAEACAPLAFRAEVCIHLLSKGSSVLTD
jgi:hypothetical protein